LPSPIGPAPEPNGTQPPEAAGAGKSQPSFIPLLTRAAPSGLDSGAETETAALTPSAPPPPPPGSADVRVALLLPMTGPNAQVGESLLNAAQLGVFAFGDGNFQLLLHDTQGTPEGAVEAATRAVGDGATLILGPLLSASAKAVALNTRAAGVPVLAFSNDRFAASDGVYTMGFLPSAQVTRVARYALGRGLRRFAVLAPDDSYGATVTEALSATVEAGGGTMVRALSYDPLAEDFSDVVRDLADYGSRRQALLSQRAELEARGDEIARRTLKRMEKLQTLGDLPFDALMVADGGKRLQAIAALLPFFDVDPAKIRMLGTGQWDAPGVGAEPALVGGWFAAPAPEARARFVDQFVRTYGKKPHRLATLAYDAAALAAVLARADGGPDFGAEALTVPSGFAGRDGIFRFVPEGVVERGLAVLQVRPRGARVIDPAPTQFTRAAGGVAN